MYAKSESKTVKLRETGTESYLCESVLVQKSTPKLPTSCRRERSQCSSAMDCSEVAGRRQFKGGHISLIGVRAAAPGAKHISLSSQGSLSKNIRLSCPVHRVLRGVTWTKGRANQTDEVPRRLCPPGGVTMVYKETPKGPSDAMARRRLSQSPPPWGCQQSQSSGPFGGHERRNRRKQQFHSRHMGTVSLLAQATQWPAWTSFRQPGNTLRNILQQPRRELPQSVSVGENA